MNTDLQIFTSEQFGGVRVKEIDSEPWFVAADVCKTFNVANSRNVTDRLDADEKGVCDVDTLGGVQKMTIVNESGLYHMLFTMEPNNARGIDDVAVKVRIEALRNFKRWITHDVLPSLRKHGMYAKNELLDNPDLLLDVVTRLKQERDAKNALAAINKCLEESNNRLEERVTVMEPKENFYDAVIESPTTFDMETVSKILNVGVGRNKLFELLREQNVLRKNRNPFQYYVDLGWFKCVESKYTNNDGVTFVNVKTVVYQKGIDGILKLLKEKYGLVPKIIA